MYHLKTLYFKIFPDTISDDTEKTGTIRQINNAKRHKPKKHWQSKAEQLQFLNTEPEQFEGKCFIYFYLFPFL